MDLFNVLSLIGGIALFLFGMSVMGDGLKKIAGGKMEMILEQLTKNPIKGVLLGAVVTAVIQSSAATTVMVIGFVNSGIMQLVQGVGIIMGANIGTTATAWILSLSGITGENIFLQLLKPSSFSPAVAFIGVLLTMFGNTEKRNDIGKILLGFAVLMYGMTSMSDAVSPLSESETFANFLTTLRNPVVGIIAGLILTVVMQSSSASIGILEALCMTGAISYGTAIPIILGQNIGGCSTAMISAIGAKKKAQRAAFIHLYFNVVGVVIFCVIFYILNAFLRFNFLDNAASTYGVALFHTLFNIATMLILLPIKNVLIKLSELTIKDDAEDAEEEGYTAELKMLDERFLEQPPFALAQCVAVSNRMAELTEKSIKLSTDLIRDYDKKKAKKVVALEEAIDRYEDNLGTYLVKLSSRPMKREENEKVSMILHIITNFERMSDHALNIKETADELKEKGLDFSNKGREEITTFMNALNHITTMTVKAYTTKDIKLAKEVEPLEDVIDGLNEKAKKHHIKRLQKGKCTIELGILLEDLLINFERVSDHCSNVAVAMIQTAEDSYDTHEYLDTLKEEATPEFEEMYNKYNEMYKI